MIMWSNTGLNTWPTHIIFKKRTNLILLFSNLSSLTHHPSSKTSIKPILVSSRRRYWPTTLIARRGHHQLIDRCSKTSTNIAIILQRYLPGVLWVQVKRDTYNKTPSQSYESLIKPLTCVSTHSSTNAFPIPRLSEKRSRLPEGPWVKWQEDGWLNAVSEPTLRTSISTSFHWSSIGGQSLLIVRNPGGESRLGLDGSASLDCRLDKW